MFSKMSETATGIGSWGNEVGFLSIKLDCKLFCTKFNCDDVYVLSARRFSKSLTNLGLRVVWVDQSVFQFEIAVTYNANKDIIAAS